MMWQGGCQQEHADYAEEILEADVVFSTPKHEFVRLSVAEAIAAGAFTLLPKGREQMTMEPICCFALSEPQIEYRFKILLWKLSNEGTWA